MRDSFVSERVGDKQRWASRNGSPQLCVARSVPLHKTSDSGVWGLVYRTGIRVTVSLAGLHLLY
jgi:hypothetical protein